VLNYFSVCLEIKTFQHTYWEGNSPQVPAPSYPAKAISKHFRRKLQEQRTEMTYDRRLANIDGPVVGGKIIPHSKSDKNGSVEIKVSQSYLNPFSSIVRSLVTPQRHIITSPDTHREWRQTFLGTSHAVV